MGSYWIGVDTGGTFTDCVVMDEEGNISIGKAPTTPRDFASGVQDALEVAARSMSMTLGSLLKETALISHGCTVATNTFLTRSGAKTGLITTRGFEDTLFMMRARGRHAGLDEEQVKHVGVTEKPEPIIPKALVKAVKERMDYKGAILVPLQRQSAEEALKDLANKGAEAIAVALLWSPLNPTHELEIKRIINELYPDIYVTISSDLVPMIGEYERTATTAINAYLGPVLYTYLTRLEKSLKGRGFQGSLLIMQSYGGCLRVETAITQSSGMLYSGPAAGVVASNLLGELLGYKNIITTDVGGTSFDVGLIYDGAAEVAPQSIVGQYDILMPMIGVKSIGAAGGSIAWVEPVTNILKVGPKSAGAEPGPVCYDRGGIEPTVTDADLVLGYLNPDYFLGGKIKLNKKKAIEAIKNNIADPMGISTTEAAAGIRDIVDAHMFDLTRSTTIERGYDPRTCVLFAYGGAGPVHASAYGAEAQKIIVPFSASVHSALGTLSSGVMHTYTLGNLRRAPFDVEWFNKSFEDIERKALNDLRQDGFKGNEIEIERFIDMRYMRQVHEVMTPVPVGRLNSKDLEKVCNKFEELYEKLYGKDAGYREAGMEMVTFRVHARGKGRKPSLKKRKLQSGDASAARKMRRDVFFRSCNDFISVNVYDFEKLEAGNVIPGPAIVETPITTIVIDAEQTGKVDEYLDIIIEKRKG